MSVARHHADWLSLIEVSGPFVSLPVLQRVFPAGLPRLEAGDTKALREAYAQWQDHPQAPGAQRAWLWHVLTQGLGYPEDRLAEGQALPAGLEARVSTVGETLRPDFALLDADGQAGMLIASFPATQSLNKAIPGKLWKAHPATRMMELLLGANVPLGLVTNGEHWLLVYARPNQPTGFASWYAALWLDEPTTLRAFHALLGVRRFFGVAEGDTLAALLQESAEDQQEVTDQLGYQVREAVEVLVQSLDGLNRESQGALLQGVGETVLYEAALTVMMRLVFLFSAEERGLLHLGKPLYDENYAVSTLQAQLQEVADRYGEEVLERRSDAWARLLATFRAVHGGIAHQDLLMPAYGGSLFDPERFPFLEGRDAGCEDRGAEERHRGAEEGVFPAPRSPLLAPRSFWINNRVTLHLLNALQRLRVKAGGATETRRVSFRALGVEQIGHVYEGLLDHTAVRAAEPVLGLRGTRHKEPEIPLGRLEALRAQGQDKLVEFLKDETGRSVAALKRALESDVLLDEYPLRRACGQDEALWARVRPFAGLLREDSFERPLVVLPGSVYVTAGTTRRSTGTHYTPPSLTEPVVKHTLDPLVYEGPALGWPEEQWRLKSPKEILELKVCDMAMGSGAFLVQACRYLAEKLVEAWEVYGERESGIGVRGSGEENRGAGFGDRESEDENSPRFPKPEPRQTREQSHDDPALSGFGDLENRHGFGRGVLPGNPELSEGGVIRPHQSDSAGSGFDSSEHRGRTWPTIHTGLSEVSEYRERLSDGVGNPSVVESTSGVVIPGCGGATAETHGTNRPNDDEASTGADESALIGGRVSGIGDRESREEGFPDPRTPIPESRQPRTSPLATPSTGHPTERLLPADADERLAIARRVVADRCLYGVDINPMAVEMAKLSLWLITVDAKRPFTFLDHAFKCGDSLLGVTALGQLENFSLRPGGGKQLAFSTLNLWRHIEAAQQKREVLEALPSDTPQQVATKAALFAEAEEAVAKLRAAADVLVAVELQGLKGKAYEQERERSADHMLVYWREGLAELQAYARRRLENRRCLHWALDFPEIVAAGGFHAFVGNPPFMGGSRITADFGVNDHPPIAHFR